MITPMYSRKHVCLAAALGLFALSTTTGCRTEVSGGSLLSPWSGDDVQYFPAGPEFKLAREVTQMQEMEAAKAAGAIATDDPAEPGPARKVASSDGATQAADRLGRKKAEAVVLDRPKLPTDSRTIER